MVCLQLPLEAQLILPTIWCHATSISDELLHAMAQCCLVSSVDAQVVVRFMEMLACRCSLGLSNAAETMHAFLASVALGFTEGRTALPCTPMGDSVS